MNQKSLQETIWGVEGWTLLTGALCVIVMGRRWIICYCIMVRLTGCGVWCLDLLGFLGSCQDQLRTLFGWWNWPKKHSSSIWNLAPLCLMWCLWRKQYWRMFKDMESSDDQLLASFSGFLFDWSRAWRLTSSDSLPIFLSSLLCN